MVVRTRNVQRRTVLQFHRRFAAVGDDGSKLFDNSVRAVDQYADIPGLAAIAADHQRGRGLVIQRTIGIQVHADIVLSANIQAGSAGQGQHALMTDVIPGHTRLTVERGYSGVRGDRCGEGFATVRTIQTVTLPVHHHGGSVVVVEHNCAVGNGPAGTAGHFHSDAALVIDMYFGFAGADRGPGAVRQHADGFFAGEGQIVADVIPVKTCAVIEQEQRSVGLLVVVQSQIIKINTGVFAIRVVTNLIAIIKRDGGVFAQIGLGVITHVNANRALSVEGNAGVDVRRSLMALIAAGDIHRIVTVFQIIRAVGIFDNGDRPSRRGIRVGIGVIGIYAQAIIPRAADINFTVVNDAGGIMRVETIVTRHIAGARKRSAQHVDTPVIDNFPRAAFGEHANGVAHSFGEQDHSVVDHIPGALAADRRTLRAAAFHHSVGAAGGGAVHFHPKGNGPAAGVGEG
ncbi:hypothetical protein D3C71_741020 [compost metagenome]